MNEPRVNWFDEPIQGESEPVRFIDVLSELSEWSRLHGYQDKAEDFTGIGPTMDESLSMYDPNKTPEKRYVAMDEWIIKRKVCRFDASGRLIYRDKLEDFTGIGTQEDRIHCNDLFPVIHKGFTRVKWVNIILNVAAMLLVSCVHYYRGFLFACFLFGIITLFQNRNNPSMVIPHMGYMIRDSIFMTINLIQMILHLVKTISIKVSSHLVGYWSIPEPFRSRISAFIFLLIGPELLSAQPSGSTEKGATGMYEFTSSKPHKLPPHRWRIGKLQITGTTVVGWTYIILFAGIMLTVWCFYNNRVSLIAYCIYGTGFLIREFNNSIRMIKNLIEKVKKNKIEYLGAVFQLSNIALSSPFLGGTHKWKASMVAGISVFAIICYCGKISVELKRAEVTPTFFYPETRNNKKVLFFTARHVLEFFIPLSYSLLACVYLTELDTKNHQTENDWKSVAFSIQVFIHVIGGVLAFMNARNPYYFRHGDQNQMIPMQPLDTIPRKGNEIILKDKLVVAEELSEEVRDVNVLAAAQGCVENQHADVSVSETILVIAEELSGEVVHVSVAEQGYVENQSADTDVSTLFADNLAPDVMSEEGCKHEEDMMYIGACTILNSLFSKHENIYRYMLDIC